MDIDKPLFTEDELHAIDLTSELAELCHQIIAAANASSPAAAVGDWNEMAMRIHAVQHMLLSQAAARAYPDVFRLLGQVLPAPEG